MGCRIDLRTDGYVSDKEAEKYVVMRVLSDSDLKFSSLPSHKIVRLRLVLSTAVACAATDPSRDGSTGDRAIGMRALVSFENAAYLRHPAVKSQR